MASPAATRDAAPFLDANNEEIAPAADVVPGSQKASWTLIACVAICCSSPLLFGYSIAFTSPTQSSMQGIAAGGVFPPHDLIMFNAQQESEFASIINIGAVIGSFLGAFLSDRLGRRPTLVATAVPHLIAWVGTAFARNWILLCALRLLCGVAVGVGSAVTPTYISEVATIGLRGALGTANQLCLTFGIFLANLVGTYVFIVDKDGEFFCQWTHMAIFAAVLSCMLFAVALLPESPRWLAKTGDREAVFRSLWKLRAADSDVISEANDMLCAGVAGSAQSGAANAGEATRGFLRYKKSLIVGIGLLALQQLSGVNAVIMFTTDICTKAGISNASSAAMVSMFAQVIFTGIAVALMEKAGRRSLLLFAVVSMALSHLALAYYFFALDQGLWAPSSLALLALVVFILGFSLGLGPIPWLMLPEIMPTEVRGTASSIGTAVNWATSFFVTLLFQPLQSAIKIQGTYLLFAVIMLTSIVFVATRVPETKGKSVEEVLAILDGGVGARRSPGLELREVTAKPGAVHPAQARAAQASN